MNGNLPPDRQLLTRTEGEGDTLDMPEGFGSFTSGQVLGERYQILEMLGRGGMGEVWHAFDLKLRVEVALKALREDLFKSERRLELLRQEVRAAREVVSPNVCRIFDLIEVEDRELVSMEYVDGATLLGVLQERGPLELKEAQDIASQFLAGLEAIHKVGLVHRDIKPENIMLTRAGRVVVMDFGLARQDTEGGGSVSGTPAYMAPEQAAGQTLDARADVYAAGVVLAEMVSPEGIKSYESRQSVWEGVRSEPANLPDSPWAPAIKKAVAKDREQRYHTAHTLTRALEDVTLRVEGAEDLHPYPGLASFTEEDAEYFFGREAEVEQMWRKLEGPARMLALVGPSGAGKSSFLRAGLIPNAGPGWAFVRCTPANTPMTLLGQTLASEMAGDREVVRQLLRFEETDVAVEVIAQWRGGHQHAVIVVDQFEELFTQNSPAVQIAFAELLGRLPLEADVHVLLSMRDDFLAHCHEHAPLNPIFSDLTYLGTPAGGALRRAVVQPATKCGYRFENDDLVEEVFSEVDGERGALPLLAFALARLWEKRDRDSGLLTHQAYDDIGGVGGALARHAEATIDRIGSDRIAIVRELFRNLVTAEGTRAVREWNELLSIFRDSRSESQPEEVLRHLIDARLLTSYEVPQEDEAPTRSVEIIHESLLANWPRLVRWQTQDADAVQLRDQLRQAAHTWDEQGRSDDTLWTGSAYREFASWRERYPGGLTESEDAFAGAMTSHAKRRKIRRRFVVAAAFLILLAVLGVVGVSRQQALAEANRAEASKLLALADAHLEKGPTGALAYATASLELSDTEEARAFVMKALWTAPPALFLNGSGGSGQEPRFSSDGSRLVVSGHNDEVLVWSERGGDPLRFPGHSMSGSDSLDAWMTSGHLVTLDYPSAKFRVWSIPDGQLIRTVDFPMAASPGDFQEGATHLLAKFRPAATRGQQGWLELRRWKLPYGELEELGTIDTLALGARFVRFRPSGNGIIYAKANEIYHRSVPLRDNEQAILLGRHDNDAWVVPPRVDEPDVVWSGDRVTGERRCWSLETPSPAPLDVIPTPPEGRKRRYAVRTGDAKWRTRGISRGKAPWSWDLSWLPGSRPLELQADTNWYVSVIEVHPTGKWLVASANAWDQLVFFPLATKYPRVVDGYPLLWKPVVFSPKGEWLATGWGDGTLRLWPTASGAERELRLLDPPYRTLFGLSFDRTGEHLATAGYGTDMFVVPINGEPPHRLEGFSKEQAMWEVAFSPSGRFVAAGSGYGTVEKKVLRIWDLQTEEVRVFDLEHGMSEEDMDPDVVETGWENAVNSLFFGDESTLFTSGTGGVRKWDIDTGEFDLLLPTGPRMTSWIRMSVDRKKVLMTTRHVESKPSTVGVVMYDLVSGAAQSLEKFGRRISGFTIDASGEIVATGDVNGIVRVGRPEDDEPHLLIGHEGKIEGIAFSPDMKWIATAGQDETLRLWPMPDLNKPPLHTLPRDELIAKLHTLTNLRIVRDEESPNGWSIDYAPFPGWAEVPEW